MLKKLCLKSLLLLLLFQSKIPIPGPALAPVEKADSGRSWRFSKGAGPGVDIFDWNRTRSRSRRLVIFHRSAFEILRIICILRDL